MADVTFNYHDPVVQLRLAALLTCVVMLSCLAALEFRRRSPKYVKMVLAVIFVFEAGIVGYVLMRLQGGLQ